MIASSEKHLEDWIVARLVNGDPMKDIFSGLYNYLGRQVALPSGFCDVLVGTHNTETGRYCLCPIEIKKGVVDLKALAQVLRYMRDIRQIWKFAIAGLPDLDPGCLGHVMNIPQVTGALLGYDISDEVHIAAQSAGIEVILYEFTGQGYELYLQDPPTADSKEAKVYFQYAETPIGYMIRENYIENLETFTGQDVDELAKTTHPHTTSDVWDWWHNQGGVAS
jgi:hypothetical protein